MAEDQNNQQPNESGQDKPSRVAKARAKSKVVSQSLLERAQGRKWLLYGGGACLVIWLVASNAISARDNSSNKAPPPPEFMDTTPDTRHGEEVTISRLQQQLREAHEELADQRESQEQRDARLQAQLEEMQAGMESEREQTRETMESLRTRLADISSGDDGTSEVRIGTSSNRSTDANCAPSDYLRPPRGDDASAVPPPPVARRDGDSGRAGLPPRQQSSTQGGVIPSQFPQLQKEEGPADPIVLNGSSGESSARILRNEAAQQDDEEEDLGPPKAGFLPMGSFSEVAMLTGADFGAAERTRNNPQPVLFRIQNDAFLPGSARYRLADCFGMGGGYGDLSSERAHINVSRISCVDTRTGMMLESPINGYIVDSDGRLGLRGKVERRAGALLGKAMLAGFAEGASSIAATAAQGAESAVTGSGVVTTIDPNSVAEVGMYGGAGRAMEILAERYIEEAESMFPVIEVPSGRRGTVVIQEGQKLEWEAYELADKMPSEG